ncbi:mannose-1-phosphate guanylyltransferase [Malaciobacter halophilus]|uniref:Mannose-1-phosphate guanylyltransferase n=1 Tax=Malaciobacter halophilus TaxID=197482 RepID=A0A2N1J4G5_9BACT|nr:nucleotidyltransferase family protein [Malaciobacter halophilus]AXH10899.1 sugar-phosphate nucleotidyltransferase [Malaciobacter halophilus]PKI81404.1 mannose-1-phosphate guanylyltransferase [Malaciobacter halophilus]
MKKALLLAAGLGTRLRPITNKIPKCLVPLNNKPLLQYWLENLTKAGVEEFIINTHYFNNKVEEFIENSEFKNKVTLVYEKELLNTAGTILENKIFFDKDEPFLVIHADNLSFCNFNAFFDTHEEKKTKCDITMMLFETDTPQSCGIVELDKNGIVQKFYEKVKNPPSNLANAAVYICNYSIFKFLEINKKDNFDFSLDVIPYFTGKINTFLNSTYHRDIGTLQSYEIAQKDIKNLTKCNKNM